MMLDVVLTMTSITMALLALMIPVNAFTEKKIVSVIGMRLCYVLKLLCWGVVDGERVAL
jgi:predicted small integral membrane protein